ncbi:MAG: HAMP domain-containing protein [Bacteroidetes bacterium]|nr:HAMP domain-containing protein [Bacteroidota bacterium]
MARITLSEKLIISFMLLSMGAIGIVGMYSYISASKAQMTRTYDQLASVRYLKRKEVEAFYRDRVREVQVIASEAFPTGLKNCSVATLEDHKSLLTTISTIQQFNAIYNNIFILCNKEVIAFQAKDKQWSNHPETEDQLSLDSIMHLPDARKGIFISDLIQKTTDNRWVQYIIVDVKKNNGPGYFSIAAELRSTAVDSLMADRSPMNGLGNSGEAYLVGKDRLLRSSSRFIQKALFHIQIDTSTSRLAFTGSDGTYLMNDYRGIKVLGSFAQLRPPCPDWAVIAEIDMKEAMVPIYSIRNNVIFITVFIAVIVFFATWWLSRKISKPVILLQKAAQELGKGKLGTQVNVKTNDEIGELAQSFNLMSEQLKQKEKELQDERAMRMRAAFDGQDMERQRLSRELHDGLGQSLIAQKLRLESISPEEPGKIKYSLEELKTGSDQLVEEVRRISNALMPAQLTQFGLKAALSNHCDEVSTYSNVEVTFDPVGDFEFINKKTKTYLFRIVQEALNNIVKHSSATAAKVEITQTKENIFLSISDNGKGFNIEEVSLGNGLNNMRERTSLLNGTFSIQSQPGSGATIEIQIPLK